MGLAHVEERVEEAGEIAAHEQRGDAGFVRLEAERDDVGHEPHVLANVFGQALLQFWILDFGLRIGFDSNLGDALLHFAHAGEILFQLGLVGGADLRVEGGGLILHAVEDARGAAAPLAVEEAIERQRRIDFHRHRRVRILPGDVRTVSHREVGFVVAGDGLFAAEDEAGLGDVVRGVGGEHLIHADAAAQDGTLLQGGPGEDVPGLARMDADAGGVLVEETADHVQFGAEGRERFEALRQFHVRAAALGPPVLGADAVAHEQGGEPLRFGDGFGCGQGFEPRQGNRDTSSSE